MKKFFYAVLHILSGKKFMEISNLCTKVKTSLTTNVILYTTPDPSTSDLGTEGGLLIEYIANADSATTRAKRDKQSLKVYKMLQQETRYVNNIANGDREKILLSGFDASLEPEKNKIPEKVIIKSVLKGLGILSAKIKIFALKGRNTYIVQTTETPDDESTYKTIITTSNSFKLFLLSLAKGKEISIRIAAFNTYGQGEFSDIATYIAQ